MIKLINYGVGNIKAFLNIYKQLNIAVEVAQTPSDLENTSKIILPGVGHFDYAMDRFDASGMKERVNELVLVNRIPVIGICVGMQMMANSSDEGVLPGLGWIDAQVKRFNAAQISSRMPLPHMGWNDMLRHNDNAIFTDLGDNPKFYFLHSYYFECRNAADSIAEAEYGQKFTCAANQGNIYGIQFHPEKSHKYGVQLLKNFAELC